MIKRNFTWKNHFLFFLAVVSLALLVTPASTQIVEEMSQQEELTIRKEILLREEGIRLRYSEGKYFEVIREAEQLLAIDENNSTALLMKDRAEQRIASDNLAAPQASQQSQELTDQELKEIEQAKMSLPPELRPTPVPTPVPDQAGTDEGENTPTEIILPSQKGKLSPLVYGLAILGVVIGLAILIFVVLRLLKSRKEAQEVPAYTSAETAQTAVSPPPPVSPVTAAMGGLGINDVPTMNESLEEFETKAHEEPPTQAQESTAVHDMVTRPDQVAASQKAAQDLETGMVDEDTGLVDEDTGLAMDPGTGFADEDTGLADIGTGLSLDPGTGMADPGTGLSLDPGTGMADPGTGLVFDGPEEDEVSSLGIDYSSTDEEEVFSESQGLDVQKTKGDALSPAPARQEDEVEADEGSTVDISLAFGVEESPADNEVTKTSLPQDDEVEADAPSSLDIGISMAPEADEQQGASEEDLTYNSLMFGGEDTGTAEKAQTEEESDDELTHNSFNKEYSNVMFGDGAADTQMAIPQNQDPDTDMGDPSTAFGDDDTAIGDASTALGDKDTSLGDPSTSLEDKDTSLGDPSTALGDKDTSLGDPSTSFEDQDTSLGDPSTAMGDPDTALGDPSTAMGDPDTSMGDPDTSMGDPSTSFGDEDTKVTSKKSNKDLEKTLTITKPADKPGQPKMGMFEKQREAGRTALEQENYGKAVQALSVAASLKPADKEVRALLEEARKKRRGV